MKPQRLRLQALAAHRDITLRLPQQKPLHEHQGRGDGDDRHDDHCHQLIGRHAELVGELVEVGGEHQHVLRITQHQRQAEQLEAEADRVEAQEAELVEAVEIATETLEAARDQLHEREQAAKAAEQAHLAAVRAIADRREGLARLSGQVDSLRLRAQSAETEIARLSTALTESRARGAAAEDEFERVQSELGELDAGEEGLDAAYEHAAQALAQADERVTELRERDREASKKVASLGARIEALTMGLARRDGAAWLLDLEILEIPALGDVFARHDGEFGWVTAQAGWAAPRALRQYASPALVEALPAGGTEERHYAWAWSDEAAGRVVGAERDATAAPGSGPTGAGALLLAHHLQRALNVSEAPGAQILCAPGADGTIEIGGRVLLDPARHLRLG